STDWLWRFSQEGRAQARELDHKIIRREDARKVRIRHCRTKLGPSLAKRIVVIWDTMLKSARPAEFDKPHGADSPLIRYEANIGGEIVRATPPENAGKAVIAFLAISAAMGELCEKPITSKRRQLEEAVQA